MIVLLTACDSYDRRGGQQIADAIRAADSAIVDQIVFLPGDSMDPATVNIELVAGATQEQAEGYYCAVAAPALVLGDPPEGFGIFVFDSDDELLVTDDFECSE